MGDSIRKFAALLAIAASLAFTTIGVARAASGFVLNNSAAAGTSTPTAVASQTPEPTQMSRASESAEPTEVSETKETEKMHSDSRSSPEMDDDSQEGSQSQGEDSGERSGKNHSKHSGSEESGSGQSGSGGAGGSGEQDGDGD